VLAVDLQWMTLIERAFLPKNVMMQDQEPTGTGDAAPKISSRLAGLSRPREPEATRRWSWRRWGFILMILGFVGFLGWSYVVKPMQHNLRLRLSLTSFAILYEAFDRDHRRPPQNLDELETYVRSQSTGRLAHECKMARMALDMARDGRLNVVWDAWSPMWRSAWEYLACESKAALEGGYVLWINKNPELLSPSEFTSRNPRPVMTRSQ
jgi:hypothetical protein